MREPGSPAGGPEGAAPAADSSPAAAASWPSTCPSAWPPCFFDFRFFFFPNMRACSAQSSPGLVRRTARNIWAASFAGKVQARDRQGFPRRGHASLARPSTVRQEAEGKTSQSRPGTRSVPLTGVPWYEDVGSGRSRVSEVRDGCPEITRGAPAPEDRGARREPRPVPQALRENAQGLLRRGAVPRLRARRQVLVLRLGARAREGADRALHAVAARTGLVLPLLSREGAHGRAGDAARRDLPGDAVARG